MFRENSKSDISVSIGAEYVSNRCDYLQGHKCFQTGSGSNAGLGKKSLNLVDIILRLAIKSYIFDLRIVGVYRFKLGKHLCISVLKVCWACELIHLRYIAICPGTDGVI
jgi:hypothetical protein